MHYWRAATWLSTVCVLLFALRHHIAIVGEVAYSYTAFRHQPLNYYQYPVRPGDELHQPVVGAAQVPRLVHQILLTSEADLDPSHRQAAANTSLAHFHDAMTSCKALHQGWTFYLWDETTSKDFVARHYPHLYHDYMSYAQTVQRTNTLRYLLLHHYGDV